MTRVALDTNVLVSALWSSGKSLDAHCPQMILNLLLTGRLTLCYNAAIYAEYQDVLNRPEFPFAPRAVEALLAYIVAEGTLVIATPSSTALPDENDRPFLDVARAADALLITGNKKHFPDESRIMSPAEFMDQRN